MSEKTFSIKEALRFGGDTLQANFVLYLKLVATLVVIAVIPILLINTFTQSAGAWLRIPLQFLIFIWQSILSMGILKACLKLYDKKTVEISDLWSNAPNALFFVITTRQDATRGFVLLWQIMGGTAIFTPARFPISYREATGDLRREMPEEAS